MICRRRALLWLLIVTAARLPAVADPARAPAPSKAVAPDPIAQTEAMNGPFANLEDWCTAQKAPEVHCYLTEDYEGIALPWPLEVVGAPWQDARVFVVEHSGGSAACALGVLTKRGWFVREIAECQSMYRSGVSVQLRVEDVIDSSQGVELQLRIHGVDHGNAKTGYTDPDGTFHRATTTYRDDYDALVVCGLGRSKTPRCTSPIQLTPSSLDTLDRSEVALTARWSRGDLILSRSDGWPNDDEHGRLAPPLEALVGPHHIVFP
jgi:hypothetical protein